MAAGSFRIATFNIHHGAGRDGKVDLTRTAEVIRSLDADLISLQELDVGMGRSKGTDQPAELADLLGMHIYFLAALQTDGGEYGIALAAREEFRAATEQLPRFGDEEPRVAIVAAWNKIGIVTTHLSRSKQARKLQTEEIADVAAKLGKPAIVLGDLNQQAGALSPLKAKGFVAVRPKKPLMKKLVPAHQIDHILTTEGIKVVSSRVVPTDASDHAALVAEIAIS